MRRVIVKCFAIMFIFFSISHQSFAKEKGVKTNNNHLDTIKKLHSIEEYDLMAEQGRELYTYFFEIALDKYLYNNKKHIKKDEYDNVIYNLIKAFENHDSWSNDEWDKHFYEIKMEDYQYVELLQYFVDSVNDYNLLVQIDNFENITELIHNVDVKMFVEYLLNSYIVAFDRKQIDSNGFNYWASKILKKHIDIKEFIISIIDSEEFSNTAFNIKEKIKRLYNVVFMRETDEEGFEFWTEQYKIYLDLYGDSKIALNSIVSRMMDSDEFAYLMKKIGV